MAAARELVIADDPAAWAALGFTPDDDGAFAIGGIEVRLAGRRIATVRREAGLSTALALMSRPQDSNPSGPPARLDKPHRVL